MRIVLAESLEGTIAEELWEMYRPSVAPLETLSVDREAYTHDEFVATMADPRTLKYLAQDDAGTTRGMVTITRHLETVRWINAKYFAARWPKEHAEGRIYYVGMITMHPDFQGRGGFKQLLEPIAHLVSRDDGVIGFDVCAHNDATVDVFVRAMRYGVEFTGREPAGHQLDRLTFYAITFGMDDDDTEASDGRVINLDAEVAGSGRPNR